MTKLLIVLGIILLVFCSIIKVNNKVVYRGVFADYKSEDLNNWLKELVR